MENILNEIRKANSFEDILQIAYKYKLYDIIDDIFLNYNIVDYDTACEIIVNNLKKDANLAYIKNYISDVYYLNDDYFILDGYECLKNIDNDDIEYIKDYIIECLNEFEYEE